MSMGSGVGSDGIKEYEKLGSFYLGRPMDDPSGEPRPEPFLYDAKDLTTHAVCVGMTGSGKTGLAISIIEEAAIDGIPVIAIDPKGDLGNLMLTFPELRAADFRPWIDEGDAARKGRTPDEHAGWTAELWRKGLSDWDQSPERIARFAAATDRTVYTPGSQSGRPLSILKSFAAPPQAVLDDDDGLRERVLATTSGLLALLGIAADPIRSREHILLSTLFDRAWRQRPESRPADVDPADTVAAGRARRGDGSQHLLSVQGPLRAGDVDQQPDGLPRLRGMDRSAIRSTSASCSTPKTGGRASRSSASRTSPTRSGCSS